MHERSIDGDLVCLLARRLLRRFKHLKLVLMSATIHTALYKEYFSHEEEYYGDMQCLSVGVRRFPLSIHYVEDLFGGAYIEEDSSSGGKKALKVGYESGPLETGDGASSTFRKNKAVALPQAFTKNAENLKRLCHASKGTASETISATIAKEQYILAVALIKAIAVNGTGILVFVSGIADITELMEKLEITKKFRLHAIHSDIPFDEQEEAFAPCGPNEVKIVLATNAAESSITLPDVDSVICLGTHKALRYHAGSHRVQLVNTWVSKASSTQRAGRTGRVRPGTVYRLYTADLFDKFCEHEEAEVNRQPLQDVILDLRSMLEDAKGFTGVVPILQELLEPPDMRNVYKSFELLFRLNMISHPSDSGNLTALGKLAGEMPVDMQLSRLIAYGVQLGIGTETCVMAAALSMMPKTPFRQASTFIHKDPSLYNEIISQTMMASIRFDGGCYSEPIMLLRMVAIWLSVRNYLFTTQN